MIQCPACKTKMVNELFRPKCGHNWEPLYFSADAVFENAPGLHYCKTCNAIKYGGKIYVLVGDADE